MMLRGFGVLCAVPLLAGCLAAVPDSGQEVGAEGGMSQFEIDRIRREQALAGPIVTTGQGIVPPSAANVIPVSPAGAPQQGTTIQPGELTAAGIGGAPSGVGDDPLRTGGVQATPENVQILSSGISDEQDFDSVSGERDIQSDAELREQQQAVFQQIEPEPLPERGDVGPNLVEYALSAPNSRGQEWYSRTIFTTQARFERNCSGYRSADEAQRDFLSRGGPERDPRGLDPDGDGFACGWDPAPFRAAVGN